MVAGKVANLSVGDNQHTQICGASQTEAAGLLNVSERSVSAAKKVQREGVPKLAEAVESGEVSVSGVGSWSPEIK